MEFLLPAAAVFVGGLIKGLTGFGYALVATSLLTTVLPPQKAVALMIIPLIAGNLELVFEVEKKELKNCMQNFSGYILSITVGVTVGMFAISIIPSRLLQVAVGILAILYSLYRTDIAQSHLKKFERICFNTWEPLIGILSGVVYGSSNIGVLIVAYLKSKDIGHRKFTGTLATIILAVSLYRILLAQVTGIYTGNEEILFSLTLSLPAVVSVKAGKALSGMFSRKLVEKVSLVLIFIIGTKLLLPF